MNNIWPEEVKERKELYSDAVWHAVRYFDALPSINTPRQKLKNRRRVGKQGASGKDGASRGGGGGKLVSAEQLFFSHPKIHELDEAIKSIVAFAKVSGGEGSDSVVLLEATILTRST